MLLDCLELSKNKNFAKKMVAMKRIEFKRASAAKKARNAYLSCIVTKIQVTKIKVA